MRLHRFEHDASSDYELEQIILIFVRVFQERLKTLPAIFFHQNRKGNEHSVKFALNENKNDEN